VIDATLVVALVVAVGVALRFRRQRDDAQAAVANLLEERETYASEQRSWLN